MTLTNDEKSEEELTLSFQIWHEEFDEFWQEHSKISNIYTFMGFFWPKYMMFKLKKSIEQFCLMALNIDAAIEGKLTCAFKDDLRNLANFDQNTWKCQNWYFHGILLFKVEMHELKIYSGVISNDTDEWSKLWRGIDLSFRNWQVEFWPEHSKIPKICTLMGFFWTKHIIFDLKKV